MSRVLLDTSYLVDAERSGVDLDRAIDDEDDDDEDDDEDEDEDEDDDEDEDEDEDEVAIAAITVAELRAGTSSATGKRRAARSGFVDDAVRALDVVDSTGRPRRAFRQVPPV